MCDSNNITVNGSNFLPVEKKKDSKIEFETSFIPPVDYKFCNRPEEKNNKNIQPAPTVSKKEKGYFVSDPF